MPLSPAHKTKIAKLIKVHGFDLAMVSHAGRDVIADPDFQRQRAAYIVERNKLREVVDATTVASEKA